MMELFDTQTRTNRTVTPLDGKAIRYYCCGPTVYGPAHIGNFRTFVMQDVLRRVLELGGTEVRHVRNLTDVDDKTIRDSLKDGRTLTDFTAHWTRKFHADCALLNLLPPHVEPSAVGHIPHQIAMIAALEEKGHAYRGADGSVYFKITSFPGYGALSHLDKRELRLGATVASDEYDKDSVSDFVLWKGRKPEDGANFWTSPWGEGRPGWHLECSAMIREHLGETIDLHSGGVDLIFPHHENEIAQSECCTGHPFCRHWFHITHLLVDGVKMAKTKKNFHTLEYLAAQGYSAMEVRWVLASGSYRQHLNFTFDGLAAARSALAKIAKAEAALSTAAGAPAPDYAALKQREPKYFADAWAALNDDLNTPKALGCLFTGLAAVKDLAGPDAVQARDDLHFLLAALGLILPAPEAESEVPDEIRALAEARWAARTAKNWAESDRLRGELDALGWTMKDGKENYDLKPKG